MRREIRYHSANALIGGVVTTLIGLFVTVAAKQGREEIILNAGLAFVTGLVIGVLVGFLLDLGKAQVVTRKILEDVQWSWPYHSKLLSTLNAHDEHRSYVQRLLRMSTVDKMMQIPNIRDYEFYQLLIDALHYTRKWDGIHHGPISKLGWDQFADPSIQESQYARAGREYFDFLSESVRKGQVQARRVIIIPRGSEVELADDRKIGEFWRRTGNRVTSYWVSEDNPELALRMKSMRLDDAALHDGKLYLQYDRELQTVRFDESEKLVLVRQIFESLDKFVANGRKGVNPFGFQELPKAKNA